MGFGTLDYVSSPEIKPNKYIIVYIYIYIHIIYYLYIDYINIISYKYDVNEINMI
jgi:hypothetical protein